MGLGQNKMVRKSEKVRGSGKVRKSGKVRESEKVRESGKVWESERVRDISKLAGRYAENRTGPMVVFMLIYILLLGAVFLGVYCFLKGWVVLAAILVGAYVAGTIYFILRWDKYEGRYFVKSGIPQSECVEKVRKYLPVPLLVCVVISVVLEQLGVFSEHLRVPVSAVYICPMFIFANWRWGKDSFIGYLWGGLYGGWAIAILFGVPILTFSEGGQFKPGDEMYLAVPVTGLLTGLVARIYSRSSFKKLKEAAKLQEGDSDE